MEILPGEPTLRGPKSKIPEDDLTSQVRTVGSQDGREGSSTEEQGRPPPPGGKRIGAVRQVQLVFLVEIRLTPCPL